MRWRKGRTDRSLTRVPETPHYTDCKVRDLRGCDWDFFSSTGGPMGERECKIVEVLHMVVKHPDDFRVMTGRDPVRAAAEYAEMIRAWARVL